MKITKEVIKILQNFSVINESIAITELDVLKTISPSGNIIAVYDLQEPFPRKFAIWQLVTFLNVIKLFDLEKTEFIFNKKNMYIKHGKHKVQYTYTDFDLIRGSDLKPSDKYKAFNKFDCHLNLSSEDISNIRKSSNIMDLLTLKIKIDDKDGYLELVNEDYDDFDEDINKNTFSIKLENTKGKGEISVNVKSLEMIPGDYDISIITNKMLKFTHIELPLFYFVQGEC